jgi:hypothetical protein
MFDAASMKRSQEKFAVVDWGLGSMTGIAPACVSHFSGEHS